ncbi:LytR/AlgR family response regulator transcription factor [Flavihumibacter sp. UBA7668]|uniref:LytR/AlgR family response regulator transcription factor n=1 Tax=Flavihumibacter sp. UBA7668 TaxID=1946542 RepID=UPI0025BAFBE0|nr:LytTR family DNA-binding domain-containing protein [Flavihumibacter sp. UBA7668]
MKRKKVFIAMGNSPLRATIIEIVQQEPGFVLAADTLPHSFLQEEIEAVMPDLLILEITEQYRFTPITGISFPLPTIFLGNHQEDALESFSYHVVDFLFPHFNRSDFRKALNKYKQWKALFVHHLLMESMPLTVQYPKKIFVEAGQKRRSMDVGSILYLKAEGDYTRIYSIDNNQYMSSYGISVLEKRLDPSNFIRIHRSYIINTDYIKEMYRDISKTYVLLNNKVELSIGRIYLPNLKELLF